MTTGASNGPLTLTQLPLFPLNSVLFPGGWMPLRIFEVRYLDMIGRCHRAGAPFGIVCLSEGHEVRQVDPQARGDAPAFAKEDFHSVGVLARIDSLDKPQPGLLMIRCQGQQRFKVDRRQQLPHGLWVADVTLDAPEPVVPVPDHLDGARNRLQQLLMNLRERQPEMLAQLPLQEPYHWNDCGWVANRWAELLPTPIELKQRLMSLDNPLLRLELVADLLDRLGLDG